MPIWAKSARNKDRINVKLGSCHLSDTRAIGVTKTTNTFDKFDIFVLDLFTGALQANYIL